MGLSKPIIIQDSSVDISNLATKSDIDSIKNSVGAVKKVQRGYVDFANSQTKDVTLSGFTDLNKMVVLLNGDYKHTSSTSFYSEVCLKQLTLNKLTIATGNDSSAGDAVRYISYQVIQFS